MCRKRKAMFESHVVIFLSYLTWYTIIYCVTDQPSITRSRRSVLNFKLSVLTFSRLMSCSMSIEQKLCKVKFFQLQSMSNAIRSIDHRFAFKNSGIACLAWIYNSAPQKAVRNSSSNLEYDD